ncbi:MAG: hypothetical protein RJA61_721 [Candidatus Parcubacteria bacterium]|jgi:hypothetical protein
MTQIPENDRQRALRLFNELRKLITRIERLLGLVPEVTHQKLLDGAEFIALNAKTLGLDETEKEIKLLEIEVSGAEADVVARRKTTQQQKQVPVAQIVTTRKNWVGKILTSLSMLCAGLFFSSVWDSSTQLSEIGTISIADFDPGIKFWIGLVITTIVTFAMLWRKRPATKQPSATLATSKWNPTWIIVGVAIGFVVAAGILLYFKLTSKVVEVAETPTKTDGPVSPEWWHSVNWWIVGGCVLVVLLWKNWKKISWSKIPKPNVTTPSWLNWKSTVQWIATAGVVLLIAYWVTTSGKEAVVAYSNRPVVTQPQNQGHEFVVIAPTGKWSPEVNLKGKVFGTRPSGKVKTLFVLIDKESGKRTEKEIIEGSGESVPVGIGSYASMKFQSLEGKDIPVEVRLR